MGHDPWQEGGADADEQVELNLTPLVDVVFSLLVVFMISAGSMGGGDRADPSAGTIELSLPSGAATAKPATPQEVVIAVDVDGSLYQDGQPIDTKALARALVERVGKEPGLQVRVEADEKLTYQRVIEVILELQRLGVRNVGLATRLAPAPADGAADGAGRGGGDTP